VEIWYDRHCSKSLTREITLSIQARYGASVADDAGFADGFSRSCASPAYIRPSKTRMRTITSTSPNPLEG
jgi:hypothetical protein